MIEDERNQAHSENEIEPNQHKWLKEKQNWTETAKNRVWIDKKKDEESMKMERRRELTQRTEFMVHKLVYSLDTILEVIPQHKWMIRISH